MTCVIILNRIVRSKSLSHLDNFNLEEDRLKVNYKKIAEGKEKRGLVL